MRSLGIRSRLGLSEVREDHGEDAEVEEEVGERNVVLKDV